MNTENMVYRNLRRKKDAYENDRSYRRNEMGKHDPYYRSIDEIVKNKFGGLPGTKYTASSLR